MQLFNFEQVKQSPRTNVTFLVNRKEITCTGKSERVDLICILCLHLIVNYIYILILESVLC